MKKLSFIISLLISLSCFATKITTGTPGTDLSLTATTVISLSAGDTLQINAGTYTGYSQVGIQKAIYILAAAPGVEVNFGGTTNTALIQNCSLFKLKGIYFHNGTYRCLELNGKVDSCLIQVRFRSFRDYVIWNSGLIYTGTAATRNNALDLRITADSIYQGPVIHFTNMIWDSFIQNSRIDSLIGFAQNMVEVRFCKNVVVQYDTFHNVNNLPGGGHGHCGVLVLSGEFTIQNIIRDTFEGEDRLRPYTIDSSATHTRGTSYYYNNFAHNSRKYGMAEVQTFAGDTTTNTDLPNVRSGDLNMFNNTAMSFRDSVVDIFYLQAGSMFAMEACANTRGKIWNNVIVRPRVDADQSTLTSQTTTVFYNAGGSLSQFDTSHNRFYLSYSASGLLDSTTGRIGLASPLYNAGIPFVGSGLNIDAVGTARPQGGAWDIGRYEALGIIITDWWKRKRHTIFK